MAGVHHPVSYQLSPSSEHWVSKRTVSSNPQPVAVDHWPGDASTSSSLASLQVGGSHWLRLLLQNLFERGLVVHCACQGIAKQPRTTSCAWRGPGSSARWFQSLWIASYHKESFTDLQGTFLTGPWAGKTRWCARVFGGVLEAQMTNHVSHWFNAGDVTSQSNRCPWRGTVQAPKWSRGKFRNGMASIRSWMNTQFLLSHLRQKQQ